MYLPWKSSKVRITEAEVARKNRQEIIQACSEGQLSRRDLMRMGLLTAGGAFALTNGLSVFAPSAFADVPTGTPRSPIPRGIDFTQPMPRLEVLQPKPVSALTPAPTKESNQTPRQGGGPVEGRPPGPLWAHQRWEQFSPKEAIEATMEPLKRGFFFHPAPT